MSRYFLTKLTIEGFRGVNNEGDPLSVKFTKDKLNSIFAPNGIGKSSIYDALYYAITGTLPKIEILHAHERSEDYYLNRFHSQLTGTIKIEIESSDTTLVKHVIEVKRHPNGTRTVTSPSGNPDPVALLKSLNNSFSLLDYHTFNMFISHSPLERGRSFSTLLGLDEYSDFRQTLRTTTDTRVLNADLNLAALESQEAGFKTAATAAIVRVDTSFNAIIGDNAGDATKIDEYCDIILISLKQVPILAKIVTASVLNEVQFDAVIQAIKTEEGGKDRDRFVELSSSLGKLNAMGVADDEVVRSEIQELSDEINVLKTLFEATAGTTRKQLYSVANHLINGGSWHDPNKCPLCESELQKPIAEIVAEQQLQYQQTDAKISSIQTTWAGSQLQHRVAQLETLVGKDVPEAERKLNSTNEAISSGNISRTFAKP